MDAKEGPVSPKTLRDFGIALEIGAGGRKARVLLDECARVWEAEVAAHEETRAVLRKIAEGKGRFSRDPLTHASNTIEDMKALAVAALASAEGDK